MKLRRIRNGANFLAHRGTGLPARRGAASSRFTRLRPNIQRAVKISATDSVGKQRRRSWAILDLGEAESRDFSTPTDNRANFRPGRNYVRLLKVLLTSKCIHSNGGISAPNVCLEENFRTDLNSGAGQ